MIFLGMSSSRFRAGLFGNGSVGGSPLFKYMADSKKRRRPLEPFLVTGQGLALVQDQFLMKLFFYLFSSQRLVRSLCHDFLGYEFLSVPSWPFWQWQRGRLTFVQIHGRL